MLVCASPCGPGEDIFATGHLQVGLLAPWSLGLNSQALTLWELEPQNEAAEQGLGGRCAEGKQGGVLSCCVSNQCDFQALLSVSISHWAS